MHRPTYFAIKGRTDTSTSARTCVRDNTAHTVLKTRDQAATSRDSVKVPDDKEERRKRFRQELAAKEARIRTSEKNVDGLFQVTENDSSNNKGLNNEARLLTEEAHASSADATDGGANGRGVDSDGFDSSENEGDSDSDSDSDEEAALQAELAKIRQERADAKAHKEEEESKELRQRAVDGNPLVAVGGGIDAIAKKGIGSESLKIKRRWNDDVIFKNTAKDEPQQKKRFINDTVRSDFHKGFMKQYLK
eukprot:GSChrysophyteH2.ASY1.ANO1.1253.1 assembled CDS